MLDGELINTAQCPCGSGSDLSECCQLFLAEASAAKTAEQLMRSRYTAYVLCDAEYLKKTWDMAHVPNSITFDDATQWLGLKIIHCIEGGESDEQGVVEFVARYKVAGRGHRLHEVSRFIKREGLWLYLDAA